MNVFMPGTKVITRANCVDGEIVSVSISFSGVCYEIFYFYAGDFKKIWLDESQFTVNSNEKGSIGFKNL